MDATQLLKETAGRFAIERRDRPRTFDAWLRQPASPRPLPKTDSQLPVLVVGAGPAGMAAMIALQQAGVDFEGIEYHSQVGGIWDQSNPLSSVYDSLTTNTSRYTTHLGTAMPREWPDYPNHSQARGYLQRCAEESGILPHIRFLTSFEGAVKSDRQTWTAALRSVGEHKSETREYRAIIFATGLHNKKNRVFPEPLRTQAVAGGLDVMHSSDYRNPARFADKRVLVVGLGVSGTDIANEVSRVAARTLLVIPIGAVDRAAECVWTSGRRRGDRSDVVASVLGSTRIVPRDPRDDDRSSERRRPSGADRSLVGSVRALRSRNRRRSKIQTRGAASQRGSDRRRGRELYRRSSSILSRSTRSSLPPVMNGNIRCWRGPFRQAERCATRSPFDFSSDRSVAGLPVGDDLSLRLLAHLPRTGSRDRGLLCRGTTRRAKPGDRVQCSATASLPRCQKELVPQGRRFSCPRRHVSADSAKSSRLGFPIPVSLRAVRPAPIDGLKPRPHDRNSHVRRRARGAGRLLHQHLEGAVSGERCRVWLWTGSFIDWELFSDSPGAARLPGGGLRRHAAHRCASGEARAFSLARRTDLRHVGRLLLGRSRVRIAGRVAETRARTAPPPSRPRSRSSIWAI